MNPEEALTILTLVGGIGTGINVWITLRTSNEILKLKLWANDKFVSKDDMSTYLSPLKQSIQMIGSQRRLKDLDPGFEPPEIHA